MPAGDGKRYDRFKNLKQVLSLSNTAEAYQKCSRDTSVIYHSFFNVTNTNFCTCDEIA